MSVVPGNGGVGNPGPHNHTRMHAHTHAAPLKRLHANKSDMLFYCDSVYSYTIHDTQYGTIYGIYYDYESARGRARYEAVVWLHIWKCCTGFHYR